MTRDGGAGVGEAGGEAAVEAAGQVLAKEVGLRLNGAMKGRLSRCVQEEADGHHLDLLAYNEKLKSSPALLQGLIDRITVQETSFFRDPAQMDAFRDHVLPGSAGGPPGRWGGAGPLRMWSAGCANGQEPYSLAMLLAESGATDWQITASDVSRPAVERTRRAWYSERELVGVSPARRAAHFTPAGAGCEVAEALRKRVKVVHHNLISDPPPFGAGECQVVFCRNVLIYFRPETVVAFLERLAPWMHPEGWLFIGYSESLWRMTEAFDLVRVGQGFAYRVAAHAVPAGPGGVPVPAAAAATVSPARAAARAGTAARADRATAAAGDAEVVQLLAQGERSMSAGDHPAAVAAFRRCTYIHPEQPVGHLHLALALEAAGDPSAALRAYAVARRTLDHAGRDAIEATLQGYHRGELTRLLDAKMTPPAPGR